MMQKAEAHLLADGRLHLHHGPIDLMIEARGLGRAAAFRRAAARFAPLLEELVSELALLRRPGGTQWPEGPVARRMTRAIAPHGDVFVTPMAAVAGAVADEICAVMVKGGGLETCHVNNGGDIAFHIAPGQSLTAAIWQDGTIGRVRLAAESPVRGIATSGRDGRSFSLGIADAVTVLARNAAEADAAATLIANAVDLPGHPAVRRRPASALAPDSDLGTRPVTVGLGPLRPADVRKALSRGLRCAETMHARGLIHAAALFLCGESITIGTRVLIPEQTGERDARIHVAQDGDHP